MIRSVIKHIIKPIYSFKNGKFYSNVLFKGKGQIRIDRDSYVSSYTIVHAKANSQIIVEGHTWIGKNCELTTDEEKKILVGQNCTINDGVKILGNVRIYKNTSIAPNVFISSGTHEFRKEPFTVIKEQDLKSESTNYKLIIEEDVWVGANCTIGNKAYLARGVILGANSFLNCKTEPYEIWGGVPARKIGERSDFIPPNQITTNGFSPYYYRGFQDNVCSSKGLIVLAIKRLYKFKISSNNCNKIEISSDLDKTPKSFNIQAGISDFTYELNVFDITQNYTTIKIKSSNPFKIISIS